MDTLLTHWHNDGHTTDWHTDILMVTLLNHTDRMMDTLTHWHNEGHNTVALTEQKHILADTLTKWRTHWHMNGHTTDTLTERDTTNVLHLPLEKKGKKRVLTHTVGHNSPLLSWEKCLSMQWKFNTILDIKDNGHQWHDSFCMKLKFVGVFFTRQQFVNLFFYLWYPSMLLITIINKTLDWTEYEFNFSIHTLAHAHQSLSSSRRFIFCLKDKVLRWPYLFTSLGATYFCLQA